MFEIFCFFFYWQSSPSLMTYFSLTCVLLLLSIKYEMCGRRKLPVLIFDREKSRQKGDATSASPFTSCFISDMNATIRKILRSLSAKNSSDPSFIRSSVNRTIGRYLKSVNKHVEINSLPLNISFSIDNNRYNSKHKYD